MKDLAGRTAIVTGASRGIGVYIARALSDQGMNLMLAARNGDALEDVRAQLVARGRGGVAVARTDVSSDDDLRHLVERTQSEFGALDVLVNNAGIELMLNYDKLDFEEIDEILDVNLRAPMRLSWMVLPAMLERGQGHIVNISSLAGKAGPACAEPYAATKAGLIGFTQSLRASYRRSGVSASVICPGFVDAGMYAHALGEGLGVKPGATGVSTGEDVASAVVRALREDLPEVLVSRRPVRPLLSIAALAPGLAEKVSRFFDANKYFRKQAALREAEREAARRPGA